MFYVTAGRGTEHFVKNEIRSKLSAHILSLSNEEANRDGKIFFDFDEDISLNIEHLFELKSVERIFVAIANYKNSEFIKGKKLFLNKLMDEVARQENYSHAQHVLKQLLSLSCNIDDKKVTSKSKELESVIESVTKKARLKRKMPCYDSGEETSVFMGQRLPEKSDNQCDDSPLDSCLENQRIPISNRKASEGHLDCLISFRLSIRCSGRIRKWLNFKKLSQDLSWRVIKATGWIVDLRSPKYEICLHISDQYVTIGIPLTRLPLSCRNYVLDPGLRGPIAWIMTNLAEIQTGDMVLDPMCGKGTLLLESCSKLQEVIYMGVDSDAQQLTSAINNAKSAGFENLIHFLQANALSLPLQKCMVNAVVCDVPFNQRYFTCLTEDKFFSSFFSEMMRVLREDGNLVLLTSEQQSEKAICLSQETRQESIVKESFVPALTSLSYPINEETCYIPSIQTCLKFLSKHNVKLGETFATIIVFKKCCGINVIKK